MGGMGAFNVSNCLRYLWSYLWMQGYDQNYVLADVEGELNVGSLGVGDEYDSLSIIQIFLLSKEKLLNV